MTNIFSSSKSSSFPLPSLTRSELVFAIFYTICYYFGMARPKKRNSYVDDLTIKQRKFVNRYVETGNAKQSVLDSYDAKEVSASGIATKLLKKPKIQRAIDKSLAKAGFDEDFAAATLKTVVEEGYHNLDKTRPADILRALKLYTDIKGHAQSKQTKSVEEKFVDKIRDMNTAQLKKKLDELDEKQKQLMAYLDRSLQNGETVEEDEKEEK